MELNAVIWTFDFTEKEAKQYIKTASKETLDEIIRGYKQHLKQSFYCD